MTLQYLSPTPLYEVRETKATIWTPIGLRQAGNNRNKVVSMLEGVKVDRVNTTVNKRNFRECDEFFRSTVHEMDI
jgi:hypothetical protein